MTGRRGRSGHAAGVLVALSMLAVGCSGADAPASPQSSSEPARTSSSASASSSSSSTAVSTPAPLSLADTCRVFFVEPTFDTSLAMRSLNVVGVIAEDPTGATTDQAELAAVVDELLEFSNQADPQLRPSVTQIRQPLADLLEVFRGGPDRQLRTSDVRDGHAALLTTCAEEAPGAASP